MAEQPSGRLAEHSSADQIFVEELIAGNPDGREFTALARINCINYAQTLAILCCTLAYADGSREEAECLKMVLEIAAALIEQVVVHSAFFVDGNQFPQLALTDFESFGRYLHDRPAFHLEGVVHGVGFGAVGANSGLDLCQKAVLLLIMFANALQSPGKAGCRHALAGLKLRHLLDLSHGVASITLQHDLADHCPGSGRNVKREVNLVLLGLALHRHTHLRLVESVF